MICIFVLKVIESHYMITGSNNMENRKEGKEIRKSLAVDPATYDLLQSICDMEQRSKINQLKVLIQREHKRLSNLPENEFV
jgi:hypothetical protein|tara:strand:- start:121 stop:363 length:243 start_codon:yes stop_codon:yes gene_type:complete